ncbi:MAG: hypothetical protein JSV80_15570 [Acidobacteriota bacterium]|nr:MAG: hypothetical protein JSV80_15570 [Acidobacteriota bacterium]
MPAACAPLATFSLAELIISDPFLLPELLLLCGFVGLLLASVRARTIDHAARRRWLVLAYGTAAVLSFTIASVEIYQRGRVFWDARWENGGNTLVLERLGWIPDVRIHRGEIAAITEFAATERHVTGARPAVRFIVRTTSDNAYWSAPLYAQSPARSTRETLILATNRRLERFHVGRHALP